MTTTIEQLNLIRRQALELGPVSDTAAIEEGLKLGKDLMMIQDRLELLQARHDLSVPVDVTHRVVGHSLAETCSALRTAIWYMTTVGTSTPRG